MLLQNATASHNRAGQITYEHISGLRYRVKITTYTKSDPNSVDNPSLTIRWGDEPSNITEEQLEILYRSNGGGSGVVLPGYDAVRLNEYIGEHTYSGPGTFVIRMDNPYRNSGVLNITTGQGGVSVSANAYFSLATVLVIRSGNSAPNNSVKLDRIPIQNACIYQPWIHNPVAIDIDGDELRYSLVPCMGLGGIPLPVWMLPSDYTIDPNDTFEIDPITGDVFWNTPLEAGEYNIAFKIEEYRNGLFMGSVIRDMQITVDNCSNTPPVIAALPERCVVANGSLSFSVVASDSGSNAGINSLTAEGAPMSEVAHTASFPTPSVWGSIVSSLFSWEPKCEEVRLEPYQVSFIATDIGVHPSSAYPLTTFETVRIRVVAPAVLHPVAAAGNNQMSLHWNPTICENIFSEQQASQVKYKVYRRNNLFGFEPDECELGVPEYTGYTYLGETQGVNDTSFVDIDVNYGNVYCYMVVTVWPDGSESYASEEFCDTLKKDIPIMTRVSVVTTDISLGVDSVQWSKPTELDTQTFIAPYTYRLYHAVENGTSETLVYESNSFNNLHDGDTIFVHQNINTQEVTNNYRVEIHSQTLNAHIGLSNASSVFLELLPSDNQVVLTMNHDVPWVNYQYNIYRKVQGETDFSLIGNSTTNHYTDSHLINNVSYCYKVEVLGIYNAQDVPPVLINWSQESCATPFDNVPPCPPELSSNPNCEAILHELLWTNPETTCGDTDVESYNIYYTPIEGGELHLLTTINSNEVLGYTYHGGIEPFSIAGCYGVTALDSLGLWPDGQYHQNESTLSNLICIDNCPEYELPNIFTPNGDGLNDQFEPLSNRYVRDVHFQLFNRWGNLIFETTDPKIQWTGVNDSREFYSDGVYYYVVQVNTIRLSGIVPVVYKGYLRLADGKHFSGGN